MDSSRRDDFYRVHDPAHGTGWCYCVAWWIETWEGWGDRTEAENRNFREELFQKDQYDGYILYVDGQPAGWCQCGRRDRLKKLVSQYDLSPDDNIWAITCFVLLPEYRGKGLTHMMISGVIADLERLGISHVQGFPKREKDLSPGEVWTGPEAVFRKAGFEVERDHPERPVYGRRLRRT